MAPEKRKKEEKKKITIETKKEIIEKFEMGAKQINLSKEYNLSRSTLATIIKRADYYKKLDVAKGVTVLSPRRNKVIEEMEKLLLLWINDKQLKGDSISQSMICIKAQNFYQELLATMPSTSIGKDINYDFMASKGWFEKFKNRSGIHSVLKHKRKKNDNIVKQLNVIEPENYSSEKIYECNESPLFWKNGAAERTFTTKEEQTLHTKVPVKDNSTFHDNVNNEEEENCTQKNIPTKDVEKILELWGDLTELTSKWHPNQAVASGVTSIYNDKVINYFRRVLRKRQIQPMLEKLFKAPPTKKEKEAIEDC
ncbi:HTH CENPB-type domain-containing protein [Caerostris extrusa]|uniref:HTH CENPB-type domain-containing protein n=1 Tax=Caerostris extrusa TaxID=172846 RepID=A0AAV4WPJ1_CAEEX|nr:HTH CENPB-type domain-containing protein [Caerostris extrusa]